MGGSPSGIFFSPLIASHVPPKTVARVAIESCGGLEQSVRVREWIGSWRCAYVVGGDLAAKDGVGSDHFCAEDEGDEEERSWPVGLIALWLAVRGELRVIGGD